MLGPAVLLIFHGVSTLSVTLKSLTWASNHEQKLILVSEVVERDMSVVIKNEVVKMKGIIG